jgi:hypothetical protein
MAFGRSFGMCNALTDGVNEDVEALDLWRMRGSLLRRIRSDVLDAKCVGRLA